MALPKNPTSQKKPRPATAPKPKNRKNDQQPLEVYCRLRPLNAGASQVALKAISERELQVTMPGSVGQIFQFQHVFQASTDQSEIFAKVGLPFVRNLISGQNGLLFTYGVTGAGKTYTITGKANSPGILPRILDVLFNSLDKNNLQTMKYVFKSDNQNGFEINSSPDAILRLQNENHPTTPYSTPIGGNYRHQFATPRSARVDMKMLETLQKDWADRQREVEFVKEINHDNNYAVFVSYVEMYNNYIYDLLDDAMDANGPAKSTQRSNQQNIVRPSRILREDTKQRVFVQGAVELEVKDANEAFDAFLKGVSRRQTGSTLMNAESSRSHSVFTIRLVQAPLDRNGTELLDNRGYIHVSQLAIVDLAGCERTTRTQATGTRLKEASNINNSLMTLRACFDILRENQKSQFQTKSSIVKYRESKLTYLFKSYFEGDGAVKMILCLNPGVDDFNETQQVLLFGEQAQEIITTKSRGVRPSPHLPYDPMDDMCTPLSFGPPYPKRFLEEPEDDKVIPEWLSVAEKRKAETKRSFEAYLRRMAAIRQSITMLEKERVHNRQEISTLRRDLEVRENQITEMSQKMLRYKQELESGEGRSSNLMDTIEELRSQVQLKDSICGQLQRELDDVRSNIADHLKKEKARLKKWCAEMLNEKQKELEKTKCIYEGKMDLARQIFADSSDLVASQFDLLSPPKVSTSQPATAATTQPKVRIDEPVTTGLGFTSKGPPVANPNFTPHLNDGKWLEHKPPGTIEMGTIFQSQIKNCKSVTNLKPSDLQGGKYTKYAITHHEATESGKIETQVLKGNVIPSSTGGVQVILNDIEILKQGTPGRVDAPTGIVSRKRQALEQQIAAQSASPGTPSSTATPTTSNTDATKSKRARRHLHFRH